MNDSLKDVDRKIEAEWATEPCKVVCKCSYRNCKVSCLTVAPPDLMRQLATDRRTQTKFVCEFLREHYAGVRFYDASGRSRARTASSGVDETV